MSNTSYDFSFDQGDPFPCRPIKAEKQRPLCGWRIEMRNRLQEMELRRYKRRLSESETKTEEKLFEDTASTHEVSRLWMHEQSLDKADKALLLKKMKELVMESKLEMKNLVMEST